MAGRIPQTKKVYVETEYDNIIVVNPNEVYDSEDKAAPRLVDHEDLVYYANLETFIIPRTKLAIGDSFDSPVINTTIATVFGGEEDLKINFLKPKGKTAFDTSWSDQITGFESRLGLGANQRAEQIVNADGNARFKNTVRNYEDTQLLGIKSIRVNIKGTGVPEVNIEMIDVQGRSLFEQGENSIYSAFFNFPYPLFYLTLKGYYGKAIRYRLSLMSFNARFDAETGNYDISLKLIGKFTALLFDTPLMYAKTAPKMFDTQVTITDTTNNQVKQISTYKGRQKLDEVYSIYKRKGLIANDFEHLTLDEFIYRVNNFSVKLQKDIKEKGDFTEINDIQDYRENLENFRKNVYDNSLNKFLDSTSYYVNDGQIYYPFKKEIQYQDREAYKTKIEERFKVYIENLKKNKTFGTGGKYEIPINFKDKKDIIKKLDLNNWINNSNNVIQTYYYRTGRQLDTTKNEDKQLFEKFKLDEDKNKELFSKVLDSNGQLVDDLPDFFVFGDKRIADGSYVKQSFLDKLDSAGKTLNTHEEKIENDLSKVLADRVLKNPADGGIGFKPTIRNVFAVIFAGADAFYRLMEDVHQTAWDVRNDPQRLSAVIPPEKSFSVDAMKNLQKSSGELNDDNVVYPWPLYFTKEKQKDGRELYTIQYPGDPKIINQTRAYDYRIWPEISFVEAYLKGTTETSKPIQGTVYDNPADSNKYVSANAIEFPFKVLPYQDLSEISTFYEIFERTYLSSHYGKFSSESAFKNQIDKFYGDIESKDLGLNVGNNIQLNQTLKNYKFTYQGLIDFMKKISNNGDGESWQTYIRSLFKTEYIENLVKNQTEIYSIDTLNNRSVQVSSDLELSKNLVSYLKNTDSSKKNNLDTYPLTNLNWLKTNVSNGSSIGSFEQFNNTTNSFLYLDDKKTIARINENADNKSISLLTNNGFLTSYSQPYVTNQSTQTPLSTRSTLQDFYTDREEKFLYGTESFINYGTSYSGNVNQSIQTTSLLNTPYFINSLIKGVEDNNNNVEDSFTALGYLYLNSLPLITTKETLKISENDTLTDIDYLASTFKKYSSIHQVPYAWVLKYGSIWYRYKKFVETGNDILDPIWKDFDYTSAYDPVTSATTTQYILPDYSGNQQTFVLQKNEPFPIPSLQSKDLLNTGFYPKIINTVENFFFQKNLFTGYSQTDFFNAYNNQKFRIGKNNTSTNYLDFGFDTTNPNKSLLKQNYYQYREFSGTTAYSTGGSLILLYPSMGGIPIDQSIFECVDSNINMTQNILNNKSLYNGSVRPLWSSPHFGYFDNGLIQKPSPTQYLKVIKTNTSKQNAFDLSSNKSEYSSIDEIFALFTPELLDKFEKLFLGFCNYKPSSANLVLKEEQIVPTYNEPNKVSNLDQKRLFTQLSSLFFINKTGVNFIGEDVDGKTLGEKQIETFTKSVTRFLNFDCVIKLANPGNFDRKLFNSFSNLSEFIPVDKLTFNPYKKGTLPGDGTSTTLLQSLAQNTTAWNTLRTYLGFTTIPNMEYQNQVQPNFPSVPLTQTPANPTVTYTPPTVGQTYRTFQDICTGTYFNITDPDDNTMTSSFNYTNGDIWYLEVVDNTSQSKNFCARKVSDSAITTNYNLVLDDDYPETNAVNVTPESYCMSFYQTLINCQQSPLTSPIQLEFLGNSGTLIPETSPPGDATYFNIVVPSGGYASYRLTGIPNFDPTNLGSVLFYPAGSNLNDPNILPLPFNGYGGANTNYTRVYEINNNTSGNYIMAVRYAVTYPNYATYTANVSTLGGNQTTIPTQTNTTIPPTPLQGSQKSFVTDFFIDNDIDFTSDNIKSLYPLIRLYADQKLNDPTYNKSKFTTFINNVLIDQRTLQQNMLNETFSNLNKTLKNIDVKTQTPNVSVNGDTGKLSLYNTLKGFNDKWIAGSDLKYVTLFEDFLFMDRANSDLGDTFVVDMDKVVNRLDTTNNPETNLMQVVSNILSDNQFMFMAMPAYINFYGIQTAIKNGTPIDIEIPNSLFGTYLEVDYTKSSPKFLCLYMGNPSEYPKPKENSFIRFGDDSFDLRVPDNPLRISDPNRDYSKTNKVVGFSVDFGVQNQNIFKSVDLDMSEMKNTSESFKVFADIGGSVAGDQVAQQSVSMYSIYKSRSYSCGVTSMGNAMIQPTMYFVLRHVPMFYGPYWIYEVNHSITERGFDTDFKGTRIPKYSLPNVDQLVTNVNKKILSSYKEKIKKEKPVVDKKDEELANTDPTIGTVKTQTQQCIELTEYKTLEFVEVTPTKVTVQEILPIIKTATNKKSLRALLLGIGFTRNINSFDSNANLFNTSNYNFYEISTENKFTGNMDSYIKNQMCATINNTVRSMASFSDFKTPTDFMVSFYSVYEPIIESLKNLNPDTNIYKSYGKALAQLAITTWDTPIGLNSTASEIKQKALDQVGTNINVYDLYVQYFTNAYENFDKNPN